MQSEQQHPTPVTGSYLSGAAEPTEPEVQVDHDQPVVHAESDHLVSGAGSTESQGPEHPQHRGDQPTDDEQVLVLESWQVALPATGDDRVDAALARLVDVEGLAPAAHPDLYEAVHRDLRATLADLDQG